MIIYDLGLIDYHQAYKKQKEILADRKIGIIPDTLIVAQHTPVFTLGRTGSRDNLLVDEETLEKKELRLIEVDRGGDITFHGPGQIVMYPIIDLKKRSFDLHEYIRNLEGSLIEFLGLYNIEGQRAKGSSGVWVDGKKIGFIGIGVSKWVSFHGASININTDLSYFSMINSCGIKGIEITSLSKLLKRPIEIEEAKDRLICSFTKLFKPINDTENISSLA